MILTIRTDKPEAEIGFFTSDGEQIIYHTWLAHRQLSVTILGVIRDQLQAQQTDLSAITGLAVFRGPGSFTGLRIGITVANTFAYGLQVPIVGQAGNDWQQRGIIALKNGKNDNIIVPNYGAEAHITLPKK